MKIFSKLYNNLIKLLKGSGLSRYQRLLNVHFFITRHLKSEYVKVYESRLYLDRDDVSSLSAGNFYKRHYFDLLEQAIKRGGSVVDIGAKIGLYTIALATLVGEHGRVFAFEPTLESFELLEKNKKINQLNNIVIEQKAVTDKVGQELLQVHDHVGKNRINNDYGTIPVNCITLDSYFANYDKEISFIKIDAEGSEPRILSGMQNLLRNNKNMTILLEYNPKLIQFYGHRPEKLLEKLSEHGFSLFDLEYDQTQSVNVEHFVIRYNNTHKLTNVLAIRK